jgi:hypothetical protein
MSLSAPDTPDCGTRGGTPRNAVAGTWIMCMAKSFSRGKETLAALTVWQRSFRLLGSSLSEVSQYSRAGLRRVGI